MIRFLCLLLCLGGIAFAGPAPLTQPLWLISNGLHTSLVFRAGDLPFSREIAADPNAQEIVIGWGAEDFYRGRMNLWTACKAAIGSGHSLLHVVALQQPVAQRFTHSDIVRLDLPRAEFQKLIHEVDRAFKRDSSGARLLAGQGYYAESRFYTGAERFYLTKVCNTWIGGKLRRSGIPIFVPTAIFAPNLINQAAKYGHRVQRRSQPRDGY